MTNRTPWLELRVIRTKDGHSLASLARASGVSLSYLSQLESGDRKPSTTITKRLADALHVPYSVLEKPEAVAA